MCNLLCVFLFTFFVILLSCLPAGAQTLHTLQLLAQPVHLKPTRQEGCRAQRVGVAVPKHPIFVQTRKLRGHWNPCILCIISLIPSKEVVIATIIKAQYS